jgi:hypothetical protein
MKMGKQVIKRHVVLDVIEELREMLDRERRDCKSASG